ASSKNFSSYISLTSVSTEDILYLSDTDSGEGIESLTDSIFRWQGGITYRIGKGFKLIGELKGKRVQSLTNWSLTIAYNASKE
ncbi:MAG: hypothetical protein JXR56_02545, partial [Candidatus Cloacimonetes bacterium]|nr:hypothetical protein [Candidatus Cloacimonadota bacterium]